MPKPRLHIVFFFLSLLALMQLPVGSLHGCHEEELIEQMPVGEEGAWYSFSFDCELCDLIFPPVLQQYADNQHLGSACFLPAIAPSFSQPTILPSELPNLRGPPLS